MKSRSNSESAVTKRLLKALPKYVKLFRNNVGLFKTHDNRKIKTGLCNGSSDFIGWTVTEITEDMVGDHVAVFTAVEVKGEGGRPSKEQVHFIKRVQEAGGIAGVCWNVNDLKKLIDS